MREGVDGLLRDKTRPSCKSPLAPSVIGTHPGRAAYRDDRGFARLARCVVM